MTRSENPIERSFELAAERCEDLTPLVYRRLLAEHPETQTMFRSEGSELVKGSMLAMTIEAILDFAGPRTGNFRMIECEVSSHDAYGTSAGIVRFVLWRDRRDAAGILGTNGRRRSTRHGARCLPRSKIWSRKAPRERAGGMRSGARTRRHERCRVEAHSTLHGVVFAIFSSGDESFKRLPSHRALERFALQKVRTDIGLLLDRIVVAIDAVGEQRVARDDRILVELDELRPITAVCLPPVHLNGVVLCAFSQARPHRRTQSLRQRPSLSEAI